MFSIEKSKEFKAEVDNFRQRISKLESDSDKQLMESMITGLVKSVRLLDQQHNEFPLTNRMPPIVVSTRENIAEIRKSIYKKLKDLETSVKSQSI